ncbi:extracellular matrix regulator RemB [Niallia sp. FSL W8-1348]|uniref:extracellular matrix regulator RemB n=1 Tax=Niallia sp. FSL W8-1348 TaxID=2954656 RepID=UPI0030F87448
MYVHIGENILVRTFEIITILDRQTVESSPISKEFLEQQKAMINGNSSSYKSIVITKDTIYFSPIASNTLKKRTVQLTV